MKSYLQKIHSFWLKHLTAPTPPQAIVAKVTALLQNNQFNEALLHVQYYRHVGHSQKLDNLLAYTTWRTSHTPEAIEQYAEWLADQNARMGQPVVISGSNFEDVSLSVWLDVHDSLHKVKLQSAQPSNAEKAESSAVGMLNALDEVDSPEGQFKPAVPQRPSWLLRIIGGPCYFIHSLIRPKTQNPETTLWDFLLCLNFCAYLLVSLIAILGAGTPSLQTHPITMIGMYSGVMPLVLGCLNTYFVRRAGKLFAKNAPETWDQAANGDTFTDQHFRYVLFELENQLNVNDIVDKVTNDTPAVWLSIANKIIGGAAKLDSIVGGTKLSQNNARTVKTFLETDPKKKAYATNKSRIVKSFQLTRHAIIVKSEQPRQLVQEHQYEP